MARVDIWIVQLSYNAKRLFFFLLLSLEEEKKLSSRRNINGKRRVKRSWFLMVFFPFSCVCLPTCVCVVYSLWFFYVNGWRLDVNEAVNTLFWWRMTDRHQPEQPPPLRFWFFIFLMSIDKQIEPISIATFHSSVGKKSAGFKTRADKRTVCWFSSFILKNFWTFFLLIQTR